MRRKIWRKKNKKRLGIITASIGVGIVVAVIIPVWGWIITVGGVLIYCGWYLIDHYK
ncbi:hypothetical protein [Clostridium sp. DJ247]|uniref:hypothetical protein n=1 Tax=Clostridium sp. DJ247 TaxID=2726188 RepID=UPI001628706D|nr:hypothetical protein [Clostridium sp. DJ247]MBC2578969.1 hypothetical protein [Clostridium sp. DJ247]